MDLVRKVGARNTKRNRSAASLRACVCLDPQDGSNDRTNLQKRDVSLLAVKTRKHKRPQCPEKTPWKSKNDAIFHLYSTDSSTKGENSEQVIAADGPLHAIESSSGDIPVDQVATPAAATPATTNIPLSSIDSLEENTEKMLNETIYPVGSLDMQAFEATRELLFAWTKVASPRSVDQSFRVLDRLVKEPNLNLELPEDIIQQRINVSLLNAVVRNWANCWKQIPNTDSLPDPDTLLAKIEQWSSIGSALSLHASTMSLIMAAIVFRLQDSADAHYVESLLLKMIQESQNNNNNNQTGLAPTIREYNIVMNAFAKVKEAEYAEQMLRRLCNEYQSGESTIRPDAVGFGTVLHAWKESGRDDAGERAEALLDDMIALGRNEKDESLAFPVSQCYFSVLLAWCAPRTKHCLQQAERFLQRMHDDYQNGNDRARPTEAFYGLVLHRWSQLGCGEDSERILRWMHNDLSHNNNIRAQANSVHFNAAIHAWSKTGARDSLQRAFSLYENMKYMNIPPTTATFGSLLVGLSRSKDPKRGEKAESLLKEQLQRYKEGNHECKPDAMNYNVAMHCWSSVGNAKKVLPLLHELIVQHDKGNVQIADDRAFCTALAALSRSRDPNAIGQAEAIFNQLNGLCHAGVFDFYPTAACYTAMQGCWASAELPMVSGQKCLSLLQEMQKKHAAGDETWRPRESNYKVAIDAFARTNNPHAAEEVWSLMFQHYLDDNASAKPGVDSCRALLLGWLMSDSPDAIPRTLELIDRIADIERLDNATLKLERNTYYLLLDTCCKSSNPHIRKGGAEAVLLKMKEIHKEFHGAIAADTTCYNMAMNSWGKVANAERAEALFWEMFKTFSETGDTGIAPDDISVSTVLAAWAKSSNKDAVLRAEVFFERIQKLMGKGQLPNVQLDPICYASFLSCLAKAGTKEAADSAEAAFLTLLERFRFGDMNARTIEGCYDGLIKCLANAGRVERAEELLFERHRLITSGRPDRDQRHRTCSSVLRAWLSSSEAEAPDRADKMLRWMSHTFRGKKGSDVLTNYASVIRCWARSRRHDSGKRAEQILLEMTKLFGPKKVHATHCCSDVVCAWARSDGLDRAEELLLRMCDDYKVQRNNVKPELRAFVSVLAALSRAQPSGIRMRCMRIVANLRDLSQGSSESNKVLDCWNNEPLGIGDRFTAFLEKMEEFDTPDAVATSSEDRPFGGFDLAIKI